ncbi:hypothetical protein [Chromobacterium sinusclupearum]|uniref:hypothetical protein n=1 Tax=Chromobacterium sinusclupearum TaxID=2077146 RepID=UPI0011AF53CD|nr:hypothetical protein [Chromobacterium sinusclupearum]
MIELSIDEVEIVSGAQGECANQIVGAGSAAMGAGALAGGALGFLSPFPGGSAIGAYFGGMAGALIGGAWGSSGGACPSGGGSGASHTVFVHHAL